MSTGPRFTVDAFACGGYTTRGAGDGFPMRDTHFRVPRGRESWWLGELCVLLRCSRQPKVQM